MRRFLAAAAVAALAATASASIVLRVTPRELADTAGVVAEGRVATIDVRWDAGRTCINTYVTLDVDRMLKGPAAGSVVVKVPGGKVGEDEVRVEGTPKFEKDESVVVFLWKDGMGEWMVLGESQGKFRLWQDEKAGKRMAANSLKGLCVVVRGGTKDAAAAEAARKPDTLPYDDLAAIVKASVDAAKAAPPPRSGEAPATGPGNTTGTTTGTTTDPATDPAAGRDPAPPKATPDPPSTTKPPGDGAPPPSKDAPAPRAGASDTPPGTGQTPPPAPEKK